MNDTEFRELVGVAIGEASMAWGMHPTGVFDSVKCSQLVDQIVAARPKVSVREAVKVLREALLEDLSEGSYYYSWQANIAMAFVDECEQQGIRSHLLHTVANDAAKRFLSNLTRPARDEIEPAHEET